jgi:hypothetical protein
MPAHADALAWLPLRNISPNCVNPSGNFVTRHARILQPRQEPVFHHGIAVANSAGFHLDAYLRPPRLGNGALNDLKIASRFAHLHRFHFCH